MGALVRGTCDVVLAKQLGWSCFFDVSTVGKICFLSSEKSHECSTLRVSCLGATGHVCFTLPCRFMSFSGDVCFEPARLARKLSCTFKSMPQRTLVSLCMMLCGHCTLEVDYHGRTTLFDSFRWSLS